MNLKPLNDYVLVEVVPPADVLPGGLYHPHADCGPWQTAKVLAVGPRVTTVAVGDVVVTKWRLGQKLEGDYKRQLLREPGVQLVIESCCGTCRHWPGPDPDERGLCGGFEGTGDVLGRTRAEHGSECIGWEINPGIVR